MYVLLLAVGTDNSHVNCICSVEKLLQLFRGKCREINCSLQCKTCYELVGCCLQVRSSCEQGHSFEWTSSDYHVNKNKSKMFDTNLSVASAIVASGNCFAKMQLFFKFVNITCISRTTFYDYQRHLICPAVDKFYKKEQVIS